MADPSYYNQQHLSPYPARSDLSHEDDYKASYDDLIDPNAPHYAPTQGHQTVAFNSSPMDSSRQPPRAPLSQQPSYSSAYNSAEEGIPNKRTDFGYPPLSAVKEEDKTGFWARWIPDSIACRFFVGVVLLETIVDLGLNGAILLQYREVAKGTLETDPRMNRMPTYLTIFAIAHVFQFGLAVDAVYARNTLQFMFLIGFNALFLVYAVILIDEIGSPEFKGLEAAVPRVVPLSVKTLAQIIPAVIGLAEVAYVGLGWKIYNEFGWKIYKYIGADRRMKKMYTHYQVFQCLVKFDLFFFIGFCVQFIGLVLEDKDWEYYLTCAALPLSMLLLIEGHLAARHENKWMMATFMSGCVGAMVYFVYKLFKTLADREKDNLAAVWKSLAIFSILDIMLLIPTFALACLVMASFGRGLKEQLEKNAKMDHKRGRSQAGIPGAPMSTNPNRMSID